MRLASASGVAAKFSTTALPSLSAVETASASLAAPGATTFSVREGVKREPEAEAEAPRELVGRVSVGGVVDSNSEFKPSERA